MADRVIALVNSVRLNGTDYSNNVYHVGAYVEYRNGGTNGGTTSFTDVPFDTDSADFRALVQAQVATDVYSDSSGAVDIDPAEVVVFGV
jgi:hypothetical protein